MPEAMTGDKFSPGEVEEYNKLLQQLAQAREASRTGHDLQQQLSPGSADRDRQGRATEGHWGRLGEVADKLRSLGVTDGSGNLTPKAAKSGMKLV